MIFIEKFKQRVLFTPCTGLFHAYRLGSKGAALLNAPQLSLRKGWRAVDTKIW